MEEYARIAIEQVDMKECENEHGHIQREHAKRDSSQSLDRLSNAAKTLPIHFRER